jgi:hypothetical protein
VCGQDLTAQSPPGQAHVSAPSSSSSCSQHASSPGECGGRGPCRRVGGRRARTPPVALLPHGGDCASCGPCRHVGAGDRGRAVAAWPCACCYRCVMPPRHRLLLLLRHRRLPITVAAALRCHAIACCCRLTPPRPLPMTSLSLHRLNSPPPPPLPSTQPSSRSPSTAHLQTRFLLHWVHRCTTRPLHHSTASN